MTRAANRAAMPTVAALVDEWRALFPGLKVIYASENGHVIGKRDENENAFTIPPNYLRPAATKKPKEAANA
jgi:hypothetical protein